MTARVLCLCYRRRVLEERAGILPVAQLQARARQHRQPGSSRDRPERKPGSSGISLPALRAPRPSRSHPRPPPRTSRSAGYKCSGPPKPGHQPEPDRSPARGSPDTKASPPPDKAGARPGGMPETSAAPAGSPRPPPRMAGRQSRDSGLPGGAAAASPRGNARRKPGREESGWKAAVRPSRRRATPCAVPRLSASKRPRSRPETESSPPPAASSLSGSLGFAAR